MQPLVMVNWRSTVYVPYIEQIQCVGLSASALSIMHLNYRLDDEERVMDGWL
jgi:hypothetical protein